jgi:hypothetical protein
MPFRPPIGISDFAMLREADAYYVDKTDMVEPIVSGAAQAILLPRPRRFGKTLNLSMLRYFFEKSDVDRSVLFERLAAWESAEARRHFQRHPVVFMTFKDVKARAWKDAFSAIRGVIAAELERHRYLLEGGCLTPTQAEGFERMLRKEDDGPLFWPVLRLLTEALERHHGERAVILIDEYDAPIQTAYANGYYDEAVELFRNFLGAGLKDNPSLFRGVLTGVLRVAKESIFSGLNNVKVCSVLGSAFATSFGFTQAEVDKLAADAGAPGIAEELRRWYDGYRFGGHTIYNPWSVLCYAERSGEGFRPYWVQTSSDDALRGLVLERGHAMAADVETLLAGGAVSKVVDEHVVLRDLDTRSDALWSLLLMSGYLTARKVELARGLLHAELVIPNEEVRVAFEQSVSSWVQAGLGGGSAEVDALARAVLGGDERGFAKLLSRLVLATFSYHDTAGREPERVYQAFVLGLLVHVRDTHLVRSNRESGLGRYDVAVIPRRPGSAGVVIELKEIDETEGETREQALEAALRQIEERKYAEELRAAGASPIHEYGVVFDGKRVWVERRAG